jgi:hypothetical protein
MLGCSGECFTPLDPNTKKGRDRWGRNLAARDWY